MTLKSTIIAIQELNVGETVGYGQTGLLSRPSRIAVVVIGYGDGITRFAERSPPYC